MAFKFGENRSKISKVTALSNNSSGGRRHLGFCHNLQFNQTCALSGTGATWRSNLVKIGQTVQKLHHFLQIQDCGRRHLDFRHKFKCDQAGVKCITGPIWRFNWVKIDPTVQQL